MNLQTAAPSECASDLTVYNPEFPGICVDASGEVVLHHGGRPSQAVRAEILAIKDRLLSAEGLQIGMRVEHELVDGMYVRRLLIPAKTLLVGKIHRKDCINVVESGDISVMTEFGSRRLKPGWMGTSRTGICKLGYAHVDTVFVNIFRTDRTVIEEIEGEIACESFEALVADQTNEVLQ